ncbi:hypothetical protein B1813_15545 [Saccharomonospora piscinae]|uniref:Heparin binding hemagglutinin HbhA n=1 Tax=Saccharomonospora piscinae TaxID=687388 RepID=A0A1V9A1F7_SACPI|nr:hypothetical protein [Saccharomonospora piscinae]OQO90921.1 hypothetical protein B1813_15545 [Saccharomonospora piscinae]TLW93615.1 hypothetical protein FFT09_09585 [Saccharomonospora piscinae]
MATTTDDVRKVMNTAMEQVRTSLLAALGAGSMAGQAVSDAVSKARTRVSSSSETAKKNIEDLPSELEGLRERLDPAELRTLLDEYTDAALKLYRRLAESGEQTWEHSVEPQVKRSIEQFEEALNTAQERVDGLATDTRERVDEVVALLTRRAHEVEQKVETPKTEAKAKSATEAKSQTPKAEPAEAAGAKPAPKTAKPAESKPKAAKPAKKTESARKKAMKPEAGTQARTAQRSTSNGSSNPSADAR